MIASPAVAPSPAQRRVARWRARINALIVKFDLLPGLQAICKGHFRGFPDYQVEIIAETFEKQSYPSIILGGREIGKTLPLAVGFFLRALTQPNFELFCVPGKKIDQAKVALRYMDTMTRKSRVVKKLSGANRRLNLEWTTLSKQWANGSIIKALAPNPGVLSEHGSVWCDEYQDLPDEVDKALDGFDNRPGDRRWLSGTAQVRGSPLHRAYLTALRRHPTSVKLFPVRLALDAGILSIDNVESKKQENGGKLSPSEWDAWFNGIFPDVGSLAWHPIESSIDRKWCTANIAQCSLTGTGGDPGAPVSRYEIGVRLANGEVHFIDEFELVDRDIPTLPSRSLGTIAVEYGLVYHGGFNFPYHSMLDKDGVPHVDSYVDGQARKDLFSMGLGLQSKNRLFVNPLKCPNLWKACEEQTFDESGEMDHLPLTHWIYAMLHGIFACSTRPMEWTTISTRAAW